MDEKEFRKRAMTFCPTKRVWGRYVDMAIKSGCLKPWKDMRDNFRDVYPLAGAIFEMLAHDCIDGSCDGPTKRMARREANIIRRYVY